MNFLTLKPMVMLVLVLALATACSDRAKDEEQQTAKQMDERAKVTLDRSEVPDAVIAEFEATYPDAEVIGYARIMDGDVAHYEIKCMDGDSHVNVTYLADGGLYAAEQTVTSNEVPPTITTAVEAKYPDAEITSAKRISRGYDLNYELIIADKDGQMVLLFDENGQIIKREPHVATKVE